MVKRKRHSEGETGPGDPFPANLLTGLQILKTTQDYADENRQSRPPRLEKVDSIPILRNTLIISRPIGNSPMVRSLEYHDAGRYVDIRFGSSTFIITHKPNSSNQEFRCALHLDQTITDSTRAVLAVLGARDVKTQRGSLTVFTSIFLKENNGMLDMRFDFTVRWNGGISFRTAAQMTVSRNILNVLASAPGQSLGGQNPPLLPHAFYEAAFMPDPDSFNDLNGVTIPGLVTDLYPFQRRSLQWLLMRERAKYSSTTHDGMLRFAAHAEPPAALPYSFKLINDINGQPFYVSDLFHIATRDVTEFVDPGNALCGGILAEEMELGKTIEMIALILTHKFPHQNTPLPHNYNSQALLHTGATLIVTLPALQDQWVSEFEEHAPGLLVMKYPGLESWDLSIDSVKGLHRENTLDHAISTLMNCDVVITTYDTLQRELHLAGDAPPPNRAMRHEPRYKKRTIPLTQINWWRVCFDEAQKVDTEASSAAKMVSLIPRTNTWVVTGTPVKDNINDLWGLLLFLQLEPFTSNRLLWKGLVQENQHLFAPLFNKIAIRNSKRAARIKQLLPSKKRYIIALSPSEVEENGYVSQFKKFCTHTGLSEQGVPLRHNQEQDSPHIPINLMKSELTSLRQTILHPQLGRFGERIEVYRAQTELLETMIDQANQSIMSAKVKLLASKVKTGKLLEKSERINDAFKLWQEVLIELEPIMLKARMRLRKSLGSTRRESEDDVTNVGLEDFFDDGTYETGEVARARQELNSLFVVKFTAASFSSKVFDQMKLDDRFTKPGSDEFKDWARNLESGGRAKAICKVTRHVLGDKALKLMTEPLERDIVEVPEIVIDCPPCDKYATVARDLQRLVSSLNKQAQVIADWRQKITPLLLRTDVSVKGSINPKLAFARSLIIQHKLTVYILAFGAVITDRQDALANFSNGIRQELTVAEADARTGEHPESQLLLELVGQRQDAQPPEGISLRGIITELRLIAATLREDALAHNNRAYAELQTVTTIIQKLQVVLVEQKKVCVDLGRAFRYLTSFTSAWADFFRKQDMLGSAVGYQVPSKDENPDAWSATWDEERGIEADAADMLQLSKARYQHLLDIKEDGQKLNGLCVICHKDYICGCITQCGHSFCTPCIRRWLNTSGSCPFCNQDVNANDLSSFTKIETGNKIRENMLQVPPHLLLGSKKGPDAYSYVDESKLRAIQNIEIFSPSYTTKLDTLVKHLLWLREEDPGAKSIIFSQFRPFLTILYQALTQNKISVGSMVHDGLDPSNCAQVFQDDKTMECLLLDEKADLSGLNLVSGNHVFLCEPAVNPALSLHVINRIERIGQERNTTVWLYIMTGTVEEHIHMHSERRRFAHLEDTAIADESESGEDNAVDSDAYDSPDLEGAHINDLLNEDRKGEIINNNDVWQCLFGHAGPNLEDQSAEPIDED